jgi:hypothetical protein
LKWALPWQIPDRPISNSHSGRARLDQHIVDVETGENIRIGITFKAELLHRKPTSIHENDIRNAALALEHAAPLLTSDLHSDPLPQVIRAVA